MPGDFMSHFDTREEDVLAQPSATLSDLLCDLRDGMDAGVLDRPTANFLLGTVVSRYLDEVVR